MSRRLLVGCAAFMFLLGPAFTAAAARPRHSLTSWGTAFLGHGRFNPVEALDLTGDQVEKLKEIQREFYEKMKPLRSEFQDIRFELSQLRLAGTPDRTAVEAKREQMAKVRRGIFRLAQEYRRRVESILTKEQLMKMMIWRKSAGNRKPFKAYPRKWHFRRYFPESQ